MFCYQCQEALKNTGCITNGVCGKKSDTANLQDLLIWILKGIAVLEERSGRPVSPETGLFMVQSLFVTITNGNFDNASITAQIQKALEIKKRLLAEAGNDGTLPEAATWFDSEAAFAAKAKLVGILTEPNEDLRSLKELILYGVKGLAAYAEHAAMLGKEDEAIYSFVVKAMASLTRNLTVDELLAITLETGEYAVKTMALLDTANTGAYGKPEVTRVNIGVRKNPGILVSGHDLRDLEDLLVQTEGTGIDVYTHCEMLPAHAYPAFKKFKHLAGNYGNAWWQQASEFESFNGPILMTTNCIVPIRPSYKDRLYTTGMAGYDGAVHIEDRPKGGRKDFTPLIEQARSCNPPKEIETGTVTIGFAHDQILALADKVVDAVKSGAIKRFVVMGGCDGRHKERSYFTDVAKALPQDSIILTAGCAKYRYNKLPLGDIGGIPRVLDAGQCNDSYSLALVALKLKEVFGLDDINKLPISFDIAWYEQKAVTVLLALLHLGVKGIRLGPTLPAFLSPNVAKVLVESFGIKPIGSVEADVAAMAAGK
ncbi:MAG: hydroxylamine reductase [Opitutaceae bacterium]|nr:hydroxylamine reductase [Opitutaceae bacterium]